MIVKSVKVEDKGSSLRMPISTEAMVRKETYLVDDCLVNNVAKLALSVVDGDPLAPERLIINAHGMENKRSLKAEQDGCVVFGKLKEGSGQEFVDYAFEGKDLSTVGGHHF